MPASQNIHAVHFFLHNKIRRKASDDSYQAKIAAQNDRKAAIEREKQQTQAAIRRENDRKAAQKRSQDVKAAAQRARDKAHAQLVAQAKENIRIRTRRSQLTNPEADKFFHAIIYTVGGERFHLRRPNSHILHLV
jgi:hypothetical protein